LRTERVYAHDPLRTLAGGLVKWSAPGRLGGAAMPNSAARKQNLASCFRVTRSPVGTVYTVFRADISNSLQDEA
jgi:hypothetical protein